MWVQRIINRWGQDWMNPFAAVRGDKSVMRPFFKLLIWILVCSSLVLVFIL